MDDRGSGLPASLELVWGLRERPRRGPKPGLTLDGIVSSAVELADAEGLSALSMSRLAERLGFTTMSLYRYVTGKDELLMLMMEAALEAPAPSPVPASNWREAMEQFAYEQLARLRAHPWVTELPLSGPPITPSQIGWMEYGLSAMAGSGLEEGEKIAVLGLVALYVRSEAKLEHDMAQSYAAAVAAQEATGETGALQIGPSAYGQSGPATYGEVLRRLIDPAKFPALMAVVDSGVLDDSQAYTDDDFDFGLQRILDGIGVLIASRQ